MSTNRAKGSVMSTYVVTVLVDGVEGGTYTVEATREGQATTLAVNAYWSAVDAGTAVSAPTSDFPSITYTVADES
jgi:hypothetical protein